MRLFILIAGIVALLMGLLWVGQGAGLIHWPASSFMIDQRPWITRGAILAVAGLIMIAFAIPSIVSFPPYRSVRD